MVKGFCFEDEQAFRDSKQFIQPHFLRVVYILFIVLFALFSLTDRIYFPNQWKTLLIIRFGVVIPIFIIIIILTYLKAFPKIHQISLAVSAWIGGAAIGFMLILNPENMAYYGGLFLVYFSSYFMIKLRFVNASITGWSIFVFHQIGYFIWNGDVTDTFLYGSAFFICANLIGMIGAYNIESMNRKQFFHDHEITKINDELVLQFDEKAKQLEQLKKSIRENEELQLINAEKDQLTSSLRESEEKYKLLATQMQLGLALHEVILDDEGNPVDYIFLDINESYTKILGLTPEMCIGKKVTEVMPLVEDYWIKTLGNVAVTGESTYYENYLETTKKNYSTYSYCPKKGQFAVLITDITDRKHLEDALHESNEKFMAIFEKSPISIEFYDAQGYLVHMNEACRVMFGVIDQSELIGNNLFDNPNLDQDLKDKIARFEFIRTEFEFSFEKVKVAKFYQTSKSGSRILNLFITPLMKENKLNGYVVHIEDITIEKQKQKEIEYLSYHDFLTNLYNRRYFVQTYHRFMNEEQFPLGIMMIDINGLKIINDAYGHNHGDQAIKLVSDLFIKVFDSTDVVARIGGDEFAILAPNTISEQMQEYKNKIIDLVKKVNIGNIEISLAIGYEVIHDSNHDIDELLSNAENFLYRHKITVGTSTRNHAIKAILNTLTEKYEGEKIHSQRVSQLCKAIGLALGVSKEEADVLELAGMYHDIGKISIPDDILNKPGKLTAEEFDIIKTHTQVGYQILKAADEYSGLAEYALSHHERWDGNGYPKGLMGTEIPLYSRIINVADSFEAMTANRPYRKGMSREEAIAEIKRCSGSQFDPEIAAVFINEVLIDIEPK